MWKVLRLSLYVVSGLLFTNPLLADSVFPEDGTAKVSTWFYSDNSYHLQEGREVRNELDAIAQELDLNLVSLGNEYQYVQDLSLMSASGKFMLPAPYPLGSSFDTPEWLRGLTMGIFDEEFGATKLSQDSIAAVGRGHWSLQYLFPEGGGLISGTRKNGNPYVLLEFDAYLRAKAYLEKVLHRRDSRTFSQIEVLDLLSEDLGLQSRDDLVLVSGYKHLDTYMMALPGEKVLLLDPQKVPRFIETALDESPSPEEARRLKSIRDFYTNGYQRRYSDAAPPDIRGQPYGSLLWPSDEREKNSLDWTEARLIEAGFEVHRIGGVIHEVGENSLIKERVNFFNGFQGRDPQNRHWMITNSADGLDSLEKVWTRKINELLEEEALVFYPGFYSRGAGIDCKGIGAP